MMDLELHTMRLQKATLGVRTGLIADTLDRADA